MNKLMGGRRKQWGYWPVTVKPRRSFLLVEHVKD
jgi:hypothetical protein